jgi:lactate dehydrogenase-like 2-hydroxyacid dehydrogenase
MKPTAVLINVARGACVVEEDLWVALKRKSIAGAIIDVWWGEHASVTDFRNFRRTFGVSCAIVTFSRFLTTRAAGGCLARRKAVAPARQPHNDTACFRLDVGGCRRPPCRRGCA